MNSGILFPVSPHITLAPRCTFSVPPVRSTSPFLACGTRRIRMVSSWSSWRSTMLPLICCPWTRLLSSGRWAKKPQLIAAAQALSGWGEPVSMEAGLGSKEWSEQGERRRGSESGKALECDPWKPCDGWRICTDGAPPPSQGF